MHGNIPRMKADPASIEGGETCLGEQLLAQRRGFPEHTHPGALSPRLRSHQQFMTQNPYLPTFYNTGSWKPWALTDNLLDELIPSSFQTYETQRPRVILSLRSV